MTPKYQLCRGYKALFIISYLLQVSIGCSCNQNPEGAAAPRAKHKKGKVTISSPARHSPSSTAITSSSSSYSPGPPLPRSAAISQGIPNIGNSCYMNASLQALTAFYRGLKNHNSPSTFTKAAEDLTTILTDSTVADQAILRNKAGDFFDSFGSVGLNFSKGTQQDASEVLIKLLDKLDAPQAITSNYVINKATGEKRLSKPATWSMYNLPLQDSDGDKQLLQDIFERSLQDEPIEMKWNDTDVASQIVIKSHKLNADQLKKLPILPIHLGRFANDGHTTSKINTNLIAPFKLIIKEEHLQNATGPLTYELSGFIEHRGNALTGGHYVTYIKEGGKWILYNDESVSEPSQETVEKAASNAYTLFYELNP